jgi:sugar/nucleoside kinase (ribokinase family)
MPPDPEPASAEAGTAGPGAGPTCGGPILAVGSVAFDTIKNPFGEANRVVGGSATYFSLAASFFADVRLVAVVGEDFAEKGGEVFAGRSIDLAGLQTVPGETFRWKGVYGFDLNQRETIYTKLNVFEQFRPVIPEGYRSSPFVFLGNIHPRLQLEVLEQVRAPRLVAADTMNFWIEGTPDELREVLRHVDILIINDSEARELSRQANLVKAARVLREMGPGTVVIKRGEHGVLTTCSGDGEFFAAPAMPLEEVFDPTGAGDTFAGGFVGYLASCGDTSDAALARAIIYGSTLASFAVEDFSIDRLLRLTREEITERFARFKRLTYFDEG